MSLLRKVATVVPSLGLVLGLTLGVERPASASVLDFEGLDAACDASTAATGTVPLGYGGLNWSAFSIGFGATDVSVECDANYQGPAYLNTYGAPSPTYAAFNTSQFGEIDAVKPVGTFAFKGVKFTSFASSDSFDVFSAYSLAINGYKPGDVIGSPTYSATFDLLSNGYSSYSTNWTGLQQLAFLAGNLPLSFDPIFGADGYAFLIDDVDVTSEEQPVPEPASLFLLGTGVMGFVVRARKRRSQFPETV